MIKVLFFVYPKYADFEIAHTLFFLKKLGNAEVTTVSVNGKPVESLGGLNTNVETSLYDVRLDKYDLILISGGDGIETVIDEDIIDTVLNSAITLQIPIASICASATFLAKAGIIKGEKFTCLQSTFDNYKSLFKQSTYTGADIEVGRGYITAKGTAFPDFTVETCKQVGLIKDEDQAERVYRFCTGKSY